MSLLKSQSSLHFLRFSHPSRGRKAPEACAKHFWKLDRLSLQISQNPMYPKAFLFLLWSPPIHFGSCIKLSACKPKRTQSALGKATATKWHEPHGLSAWSSNHTQAVCISCTVQHSHVKRLPKVSWWPSGGFQHSCFGCSSGVASSNLPKINWPRCHCRTLRWLIGLTYTALDKPGHSS